MKKALIRFYLSIVTMSPAAEAVDPIANLDCFSSAIESLRAEFNRAKDEKWLRMAIKSLIHSPEGRIGDFQGQVFPFRDRELLKLFTFTYTQLWSENPLSDDYPLTKIEFVSLSDEEWHTEKAVYECLLGL